MRSPVGYQCDSCSKIHYPYHKRCLECKNTQFTEICLPSTGILITYSIIFDSSAKSKEPLCLGIVELTLNRDKVRYTGQLDVKTGDIQLGMKMHAKWGKLRSLDNHDHFGFLWIKSLK